MTERREAPRYPGQPAIVDRAEAAPDGRIDVSAALRLPGDAVPNPEPEGVAR